MDHLDGRSYRPLELIYGSNGSASLSVHPVHILVQFLPPLFRAIPRRRRLSFTRFPSFFFPSTLLLSLAGHVWEW
jgi:hypothetical protein